MEGLSVFQLERLDLEQLITLAQADPADNSRAMNEIVRRFRDRAARIAAYVCNYATERDWITNTALIELVRVVRRHDPSQNGFVTYADISMRRVAQRESMRVADDGKIPDDIAAVMALDYDWDRNGKEVVGSDPSMYGTLTAAIEALPAAQQLLVERRYDQQWTVTEIATTEGVTPSAISQRLAVVHAGVLTKLDAVA